MLARKFGREVANYFSGSPLNRLGFLRSDHVFLGKALKHPSTKFMLCKDLQPLVQSSENKKLAFVKFEDVKSVVGEDPYARDEKEMHEQYNSEEFVPQMIFLGIDESDKNGLDYQGKNRYIGAPCFALDVSPKGSVKGACEDLIAKVEKDGVCFGKGRIMELEASDGMLDRRDDFSGDKQTGTLLDGVGSSLSQLICPLRDDFVQGTVN
jgi:NAD+ diphosphatase